MRWLISTALTAMVLSSTMFHAQPIEMRAPMLQPEFPYCYEFSCTEVGEMYVVSDEFFASLATGMTSTSYHRDKYLPDELVLTGPEEGSGYNSRTYYLRIYAREDTWKIERFLYGTLESSAEQNVLGHCLSEIYYVDEWINPDL